MFIQSFANASDCVTKSDSLNFYISKIEGFLQDTFSTIWTSFAQCLHIHHCISCSSADTLLLCWELQAICCSSSLVKHFSALTWEMNCSPQILYGYWFWFYYHCWYIICKFRSFLTQFCVNNVITGDKVLKIL